MNMKALFTALLIWALPALAFGQTTVDSKDVQIAKKKMQIGTDTSNYFTAIKTVLNALSKHKDVPTAKAVYDYIEAVAVIAAVSASPNAAKIKASTAAANGVTLQGTDGVYADVLTSAEIEIGLRDTSILAGKIARTGATTGQGLVWNGSAWAPANIGGGGGGSINTTARLTGDGSIGSPLDLAQQSATTGQLLLWGGAAWVPSHGTPYTYVVATSSISSIVNTVLIGEQTANITLGLPSCSPANDSKVFHFQKTAADAFGVTIDPSGSEAFNDAATTKTFFGNGAEFQCTCRYSAGVGKWFFNF